MVRQIFITKMVGNIETWYSLFVSCSHLASEGPTAPPCTAVTNQIQVSPLNYNMSHVYLGFLTFFTCFINLLSARTAYLWKCIVELSVLLFNYLADYSVLHQTTQTGTTQSLTPCGSVSSWQTRSVKKMKMTRKMWVYNILLINV